MWLCRTTRRTDNKRRVHSCLQRDWKSQKIWWLTWSLSHLQYCQPFPIIYCTLHTSLSTSACIRVGYNQTGTMGVKVSMSTVYEDAMSLLRRWSFYSLFELLFIPGDAAIITLQGNLVRIEISFKITAADSTLLYSLYEGVRDEM